MAVTAIRPRAKSMPRYYFHVRDGEQLIEDKDGVKLADLESLGEECKAIVESLLQEEGWLKEDNSHLRLEVVDELGEVVFVVPFRRSRNDARPITPPLRS